MNDVKFLFSCFGSYRRDFVAAAILIVCESILELFIPFLMASIIDVGIGAADVSFIMFRGAEMGACALLALVFGLGYARFAARAAMGLGANLREAEYAHIQRYAFSNLDHFEVSSLVTRMTTDVTVIQNAVTAGIRPMVRGPVMLVMGLVLASLMNAQLAIVFFVVLPFLGVVLGFIVRHVGPLYRLLQSATDRVNDVVQENLTAIRAVKAYVRGDYEEKKFGVVNGDLASVATTTFRYAVLNMPAFQFSMYTSCVLILWLGGQMILAGTLQVGELTGFMSYVLQIMNSLMMISNVFLLLARALTSLRRVSEVLEEEPAISSASTALTHISSGSVEFRDVSFKYSPSAAEDVLAGISLSFTSGSTVGILGATGSGKTSLVQLIPRLYDVSKGAVLVGDHDVRNYDLVTLRDAVGIVLQSNTLFSGTVRENLLWGNEQASDEEILEACRLACVDEFLERIGGLDGDLGQGGVNVSGGQKQRLCIARTLLKHPKILIFDDSTSAVDMATDARIRAHLAAVPTITKIIIAQRVNSVMDADQIVILDNGRVHATGTHAELLACDPIYQELYESQTKAPTPVSALVKGGVARA
jgi:ATP-binding cassette subfamily B protein